MIVGLIKPVVSNVVYERCGSGTERHQLTERLRRLPSLRTTTEVGRKLSAPSRETSASRRANRLLSLRIDDRTVVEVIELLSKDIDR